jgi:phytoene dehydrogenase-like protein
MTQVDVAVIGAGHNGLTCACYLARAGKKVLVLERRHIVGGAVCTQDDLIPGYRLDVGSSAHIMIHLTPVLRELELHRFGLEYLEMDPWAHYPILGTGTGISFYRDLDRTCASIAAISPRDAEAYRAFVQHWGELNEGIFETFLQPPTPGRIFRTMLKRNLRNWRSRKLWSSLDTSRQLMAPYGQVIEELFEHPAVRTALAWLSAQSGPAPSELASGDMLGWNAMIHKSGAKRAKGGSGALTQALARRLESDGGRVVCNAEVTAVRRVGGAWEIAYGQPGGTTETIAARQVVGACHLHTLFGKLLVDAPAELKKRVARTRIGNGFGMIVRHAVEELPDYGAGPAGPRPGTKDYHTSLQLLCPSMEHLLRSHRDFSFGLPPREPSVVAMTFSALDPTLAPEGKHTLFTWGQYHPYELSNGEHWDAIAEREADKLYDLVCRYAPNMRGKMIARHIQTPLEIERTLSLLRANVMHLEMSLDQMFMFRPLPELSAYRVPGMEGLYLTGASTHPGGGVFAASGYNTARVILRGG